MSRQRLNEIAERIGFDWIPIVIGMSSLEDTPPPSDASLSEMRQSFSAVEDKEKLDYAIEYCDQLLKREDDRSDKIESKAFTLIGITGIATGFITGFAGLLLDRDKLVSNWILIPSAALYILVALSLIMTVLLAVKVIVVGDYWFSYPSASDILTVSRTSLNYFKRKYATSLFYSFNKNVQAVNRKATYLGGSQLWFRNSIVLLLLLTLILAGYAFFLPAEVSQGISPTVTPTMAPSLIATPTNDPISTSQPTGTPTGVPSSAVSTPQVP
jgi:hypothetical protein